METSTPVEPDQSAVLDTSAPSDLPQDGLVQDDLLVEDVSIDGMCGVY